MEPQEPEDEQCTCPAFAALGDHAPTCMLYTPISSLDIPEWQRRSNGGGGGGSSSNSHGRSRPSSYMTYGIGIVGGSGSSQYPPPSNVSSVAESFASTSSILDSMAATETESLASYAHKRSTSVCSFSSAASSSCILPTELLRGIFKYLASVDLRTTVQVSRQWRSAGNPLLWRTMSFPLDKRRLAAMKPILSSTGHHVRRVIITPPLLDGQLSRSGSSRRRAMSNATTPLGDGSASATPSTFISTGRRPSRASMATSPSPLLPPVYAVPIPGTPGPGNVISESLPLSASGSSWGAGGLTGMNIPSLPSASSSSRPSNAPSHFHEVSEGTVLRMHQFMERYCPNVLEAVIKNPAGISSHSRRLSILIRLFTVYPRIERLDMSDFIMWDTQPLRLASEQLRMLRSLDVTNRVELSDMDLLPVVENCPRLSELRIRATNASDTTINAIIRNLSETLVILNVGGCPVSSAAMAELVTTCKNLQVLQMWSCLRLDDSFLLALSPRILTKLQVLDMMDVQKFSVEAVQKTFGQQQWPYIKYLRIRAKCDREDFVGVPERAMLKLNSPTILD
ncbi:hypothetical protein IWW51_001332 [Coemansia sp. RSA 2702]|nr:hypothetical protein IWW51_001332 [Coemansia sp. RSA 2702]